MSIGLSEEYALDDYWVRIAGIGKFRSVYVDIAMCLPDATCGCYHLIKYHDGRQVLVTAGDICKMYLNRRCQIDEHFRKYINHVCVKKSLSGLRYLSIVM